MAVPETYPFERLLVRHAVDAPTTLTWELSDLFRDPRPHEFQLQVAPTSAPAEDDWLDVGLPAENAFFLVDDEKRDYGKTEDHHWRIRLTTPRSTYASGVATATEGLGHRDWRLVREMVRQQRKLTARYTGVEGSFFKRRRYGPPCVCVEPITGESTRSDCPFCFGTGRTLGYHAGVPGVFAELGLEDSRESINADSVGTDKPIVIKAVFPGFPLVSARDFFAETMSGRRWFIERVTNTATHRGYTFRVDVELRQAPRTDPVHQIMPEGL